MLVNRLLVIQPRSGISDILAYFTLITLTWRKKNHSKSVYFKPILFLTLSLTYLSLLTSKILLILPNIFSYLIKNSLNSLTRCLFLYLVLVDWCTINLSEFQDIGTWASDRNSIWNQTSSQEVFYTCKDQNVSDLFILLLQRQFRGFEGTNVSFHLLRISQLPTCELLLSSLFCFGIVGVCWPVRVVGFFWPIKGFVDFFLCFQC